MTTVKDLDKVESGIYILTKPPGPEELVHQGVRLYRFMDTFYIDTPALDELSETRVMALCRARLANPNSISISPANQKIRKLLEDVTWDSKPNTVLEIGAGAHPILTEPTDGINYILSDVDPTVVKIHTAEGQECVLFSGSKPLPYGDGYFDLMISAFVFQFKIYESQVQEISRCLSVSGALIANVYRRGEASRAGLESKFKKEGLVVERLKDPSEQCKENEYWVIGKESSTLERYIKAIFSRAG